MTPSTEAYDRDLIGYGADPVDPKWPGGARVALQISLAYETGGEENLLHGDTRSEGVEILYSLSAQRRPGREPRRHRRSA